LKTRCWTGVKQAFRVTRRRPARIRLESLPPLRHPGLLETLNCPGDPTLPNANAATAAQRAIPRRLAAHNGKITVARQSRGENNENY
jgi:hypothetical protein